MSDINTKFNFEFDAPVTTRVLNRGFVWIFIYNASLWWYEESKVWSDGSDNLPSQTISSSAECRCFRKFKRHLRKHHETLKGCKVVLVSRYHGHNITVQLQE